MTLIIWLIVVAALLVVHLIVNKRNKGLSQYPGPALAGYTNLWRFFSALGRQTEQIHVALHRKHGDIVRLGPNALSFADPACIPSIYGLNKGMIKSDFYPVQQAVSKGERLQSLFSTQDEAYHARYKRCINAAFSMTTIVQYESLVDSTLKVFMRETDRRYASTGAECDLSTWMQYFAFDVVGELTWSKRIGFLERGEDVDGIISFLGKFLAYASPVGQMPWLDKIWLKNPLRLYLQKLGISTTVFAITRFALERESERAAKQPSSSQRDLLSKFHSAQHAHPTIMTDSQVLASCTSMIFAGSETTAISLCAVFYHLLKHSNCYTKLQHELDSTPTSHIVSWSQAQSLTYLDAVIRESFRLHPAAGLTLERIVPPCGADINGTFIPGGTIVGCNAWVLHRRPEVFGEDVDSFRPERWLDVPPTQLNKMKAAMFQFGAGGRTCLGRHVSLLEIYKLVPTLMRSYDLEMVSEGKCVNNWFVKRAGFRVKFKKRWLE
ncbi:cytochrome protein [Piedraia hortae CBS 480.64]|uniref:Cytochrome protein n=1 Tax=Piedraia hortae CBS 480.64 TaxID=1314780 RepID=A0A6A7CB09_9PEZI|nr:cytochrome protein [Piedraia hortae CBS 480.64]